MLKAEYTLICCCKIVHFIVKARMHPEEMS